ncbi:hypothetical protein EDB80DRAFT_897596 [Ilyonectria destructans]|nr:hypothetical protein EDB80DRAFT_897596 [Ilyonectria destructans]
MTQSQSLDPDSRAEAAVLGSDWTQRLAKENRLEAAAEVADFESPNAVADYIRDQDIDCDFVPTRL